MFNFWRFVFLLAAWPLAAADLYVWQRDHTPALAAEIRQFYSQYPGNLAFWAGEIENNGTVNSIAPPATVDFKRSTAVIRIHVKQMQNSPAQLADKIVKIYQPWQQCNALQIDLDAPESKLGYYRSLMLELRKRLPETRLSITVLPCHIKHTAEFYRLAAVCDYYVLQVHGLDKSRGKWFILDGDIAADAIKRAEKLAFPYQAALPLYCHRIKGGKLVQPDLALTAGLAQQAGGKVIGFRLGVPGEREALTMQSAMEICHGRHAPELKFQWQHQPNGAWFLLLTNRGFFPQRVECSFTLPENVRISDMDSFGAARLDYTAKKFTFELPPDGATQNILWLRTDKNVDLSQHNNFTIKMKEL